MSEWLARLKGHGFDLEGLSDHLHSLERNVKKDEDGHYYLRSSDFDSLADDGAVRERALELVEHMNWAAKFHSGHDYRPVKVDAIIRVDEEGGRHISLHVADAIEARDRASARLTGGKEGDATKSPQPSGELDPIVALAERDQRVADALRYFARDDWVNLYKAWEVVADAAGGAHNIIQNGWATREAQSRFTGTAQSKEELGDEARHASERYKAPKNPLTLHEARAFVKSVIEAWVRTL